MTGNTIWKLVVSLIAVVWAITSLIPTKDTPFDLFIVEQAQEDLEGLNALLERVEVRAQAEDLIKDENDKGGAIYLTLRRVVEEERYELSKHFPQFYVKDSKNIDKRNDRILRELNARSKGSIRLGLDLQGGSTVTLEVAPKTDDNGNPVEMSDFERGKQLEQAIEVIRNRVDSLGVAEPVIRTKGEGVEVQMPGVDFTKNPEFVDTVIRPAALEFALVNRTVAPPQAVPPGYRAMTYEIEGDKGEMRERTVYVKRIPEIEGGIKRAYPQQDQIGNWNIGFELTDEAKDKFGKMTQNIYDEDQRTRGRGEIATILDGKLESAFGVKEPITGGRGSISGSFTQIEAIEYSSVLNNPLEFGLDVVHKGVVGPTYAKDAQEASKMAGMLGAGAVLIFMVFVYWMGGIVAAISVVANVLLVLGTLAQIGATITLPGVAALVLTVGMAVDAQILIFERIREELKAGKSLKASVVAGFEKVFSTIVDANVTTLVTAVILILMGVGAVRGFGITLTIGIFSSVFCALVMTRGIVDVLLAMNVGSIVPKSFMPETNMKFLSHWRKAFAGSWMLVLVGLITLFGYRHHIMGIEFVGGEELTISYDESVSTSDLYAFAEANDLGEITPNYLETLGGGEDKLLSLQTEIDRGDEVFKALQKEYPSNGFELIGQNAIGASVGDAVKVAAFWSVITALIGILLYVALRFETGYGIGAVVATTHDLFMTLGMYVVLGQVFGFGSGQFTAPMIAAILMVLGYSINDTIVVFDRIREELELDPKASLRDIINLAVNRTLSRTLLTSITTFLAAICLYAYGAGVVVDFALVFIIGILTGTFSSIFIASPVFFWWHKGDRKHVEEQHDIMPKYDWEIGNGPDREQPGEVSPEPAS